MLKARTKLIRDKAKDKALREVSDVGDKTNYADMTFAELLKIRRKVISDLKQVDKKMKELAISIGRSTAGGGNYKPNR